MPGKVLIIDDIATNRVMLKVKLAAACYRVVQASSAQDGLTAARAARPDIILTPARLGDASTPYLSEMIDARNLRELNG